MIEGDEWHERISEMSMADTEPEDELTTALRELNEAAYAAIRAGKDTTAYPYLDRQALREIAKMTDRIFEEDPTRP